METNPGVNFWWMKSANKSENTNLTVPKLDLEISSSLADFLEKEQNALNSNHKDDTEVDVGSIIEEINRVAAQSPLGPFNTSNRERSVDDIMKEAEKVYLESSKSFEQLSQRSKTSQNISEITLSSNNSTPTPKSISPLPLDPVHNTSSDSEDYSDDFSNISKVESPENEADIDKYEIKDESALNSSVQHLATNASENSFKNARIVSSEIKKSSYVMMSQSLQNFGVYGRNNVKSGVEMVESQSHPHLNGAKGEELIKEMEKEQLNHDIIKTLEDDNISLRNDIKQLKMELQEGKTQLEESKKVLSARNISSPRMSVELGKALEDLKDSKEINTALQVQLETLNKTHSHLKNSYDDVLGSNKNLERKVFELDSALNKYKSELLNIQRNKDKIQENESSLHRMLEVEKTNNKSLKMQSEKDARCIQDMNRQIKEMERIIARKHPDSVSSLIIAAKRDETDQNLSARKLLEDRIKTLENEVSNRDVQSSKVFVEIQDKFNLMKNKYENHIEDLELHVSDLKSQLKQKRYDTYDIYTQTYNDEQKIPEKDMQDVQIQTEQILAPSKIAVSKKKVEKPESHLLATIRGLQADLNNKEKIVGKLQKDVEELRKTNRRLQKEREGSLRNLSRSNSSQEKVKDDFEEVKCLRAEKEKIRQQLVRLEEDYQVLKNKRLYDLTALQEAHEREISTYVNSAAPLREQSELLKVSVSNLTAQLSKTKEELAIVTVERDHLNRRVLCVATSKSDNVDDLKRQVAFLETRYEERENRLRAIVHGLAQKNVTNRSCEQCADRQRQLIGYKNELDQLLATLRALK